MSEFSLEEAILIAVKNDPGINVKSVSRTFMATIDTLQRQLAEANKHASIYASVLNEAGIIIQFGEHGVSWSHETITAPKEAEPVGMWKLEEVDDLATIYDSNYVEIVTTFKSTARRIVEAHNATAKTERPAECEPIRSVATVVEQIENNCAIVAWIDNPVPDGQELLWDHRNDI